MQILQVRWIVRPCLTSDDYAHIYGKLGCQFPTRAFLTSEMASYQRSIFYDRVNILLMAKLKLV